MFILKTNIRATKKIKSAENAGETLKNRGKIGKILENSQNMRAPGRLGRQP